MEKLILILYILPLVFILLYSAMQLQLIYLFNRAKKKAKGASTVLGFRPRVTIQLPIYNERYVVERLLDAVALLDYPKELVDIQVLDDSTDDTVDIIAQKVLELREMGWDIEHVQRSDRSGFKAGALAYGLAFTKGEFIAIFDADFIPKPDFLLQTLPSLSKEEVGLVQTRWEHLNEDYSLLTQLQALALDAHFSVEQLGRSRAGHFMNFNGTAGVWRKSCIDDAGGWEADTLTEDLDLSYRAQLKGWKFVFLPQVGTPSELPVAMNALKSQQFRWTKGAAECARKNLGAVIRAKDISWSSKIHAFFHLLNSLLFICILFVTVLSIPLLWIKSSFPEYNILFKLATVAGVSIPIVFLFFWTAFKYRKGNTWKNFALFSFRFPLFLALSMSLALHNAIAVVEGYIGKKSPFVRTPKFNVKAEGDWKKNQYIKNNISVLTFMELLMAIYFLVAILLGAYLRDLGMLPIHLLLFLGYSGIVYTTFKHRKVRV